MNPRKHSDPLVHMRYNPFLKSRAQAWYLGQDWQLTFDEYLTLWTLDHWHCRGKGAGDLVMIRWDTEGPWSISNCAIVTRKTQLQRTAKVNGGKFTKGNNGTLNQVNS